MPPDTRYFVAADRRLALTPEVLAQLRSFAQHDPTAPEAGGLLIGRLSEGNTLLTIERITTPLPGDVRARFAFERLDPGHAAACREAWDQSERALACWGSWHTHAEPDPLPSLTDLHAWHEDVAATDAGDSFAIIVGTEHVRVWALYRSRPPAQLYPLAL